MSNQYREIEIKHPLVTPVNELILTLEKLGAVKELNSNTQEDIYYTPAHKNFLSESIVSEWLRIRLTNKKQTFNYKRWLPVGAEIQTHCDEYETEISDPIALEKLLSSLDMKEIVRVKKDRSIWTLEGVEISIDKVDGLGNFIELEAKSKLENIEEAHNLLQRVLKKLNIEIKEQDRRGYPYQLLNRAK